MDDVQDLEQGLHALSEEMTAPGSQECLSCYLAQMLARYGCVGHRFTRRWARSRRRGTEGGLVRWAADSGGLCCDCEVTMNSLSRPSAGRRGGVLCDGAAARLAASDEAVRDAPLPLCTGVPGGLG